MALERFVKAQERDYAMALAEIKNGRKRSHWMWYVFPQIAGLGFSEMAQRYAIANLFEANDYMAHPVLGTRLVEISKALLQLPGNNATEVMGSPDDVKLRSCMTLFAMTPGANPVFKDVLNKYYNGIEDPKTINIVQKST